MGCDYYPDSEEIESGKRFHEAIEIRKKLQSCPLSFLTFGDLEFLSKLFSFKYSLEVSEENLERLRGIELKFGEKSKELKQLRQK